MPHNGLINILGNPDIYRSDGSFVYVLYQENYIGGKLLPVSIRITAQFDDGKLGAFSAERKILYGKSGKNAN